MKKGKIIEALILPEDVIQRIQSFINGKEAARSTILSKSWYTAWLTRPAIDFDHHRDFPGRIPPFEELMEKTMKRYQDLNLKVERFRLCMNTFGRRRRELARDMIAKAFKFGATYLEIEFYSSPPPSELPQEVLASETLITLSARGYCQVIRNGPISTSRLKSLTLEHVVIATDMLKDIVTCCSSSIKELSLSQCSGLILSAMNLHEAPIPASDGCRWHVFHQFLVKISLLEGSRHYWLRWLLENTNSFHFTRSQRAIRSTPPNIRKFTYYPYTLPSPLCIRGGTSREWEFDVSLDCNPLDKSSTWCLNLKELLEKFSPSRISVYVQLICAFDLCTETVPKPLVVENLSIEAPPSLCCALMVRLFGMCRPKFITQVSSC